MPERRQDLIKWLSERASDNLIDWGIFVRSKKSDASYIDVLSFCSQNAMPT